MLHPDLHVWETSTDILAISRALNARGRGAFVTHKSAPRRWFLTAPLLNSLSQKELLDTMEEQFWAVQRNSNLPVGDFPDIARFKCVSIFRTPAATRTVFRVLNRAHSKPDTESSKFLLGIVSALSWRCSTPCLALAMPHPGSARYYDFGNFAEVNP